AFVLAPQPRVDPERLDADDLLLLVTHRAGHVHHVDDDRVRDRLLLRLPGAVAHVVPRGDHDGPLGIVSPHHDLPLQRGLERALEMAERVRADAADADVAILLVDDLALAPVFDLRKFELLAEDVGQLVERDVHLEHVLARVLAGLSVAAGTLPLLAADRIALLAVALADAPALL